MQEPDRRSHQYGSNYQPRDLGSYPSLVDPSGNPVTSSTQENSIKTEADPPKWLGLSATGWQGLQAIFTLLLLVITGILACYAIKQWRAMSDQVTAMNKTLIQTQIQTRISQTSAYANILSAVAAAIGTKQGKDALEASIRQSNQTQRAWIAPVSAMFSQDVAKGTPQAVEIAYGNTGREPAIDTRVRYKIQRTGLANFSGMVEADNICKGIGAIKGSETVYPGPPGGYGTKIEFPANWFTDEDVNGKSTVVIEICFAYRTVGEVHTASACYFYRAGFSDGRKLNICTAGNHAN